MAKLKDKDIREPLFEYLEEQYGKVRILEEKKTGKARADVMMVTPEGIYGIEIKSDADTYTRLSEQVRNYDLYFNKNIVVVGSSHGHHIKEYVPAYWGIVTCEMVDGKMDFYELRAPLPNKKVKPLRQISFLWRPELNQLLAANELPKYAYKSKDFVQRCLIERVEPEVLWPQVYDLLFERDYTALLEEIQSYRAEQGKRPKRKPRRWSKKKKDKS
ncbi:MAG: sce7726 family protein [Lachnospiraceae bacterium]|nr:sce7726 family protein [Lachnospiraceae bacterium]